MNESESVNQSNDFITFLLTLNVRAESEEIEKFIQDIAAPQTFDCDEPDTIRFEWFLSSDKQKVTLIEMFKNSDAAKLRIENLISGPVVQRFNSLFDLTELVVLGAAKNDLREVLDDFGADFRSYSGGFYKYIS